MKASDCLQLAVFISAVGVRASIPPHLSIELLQRLGVDTSVSIPGSPRPISSYMRHVFQQIQEKQDVLRIFEDRDPKVQFYSSSSENSNGIVEFDLTGAPVIGTVTKIEVAFTGHTHRLLTLDILSPRNPGAVVTTVQTPQGPVADVTHLVANQITDPVLTLHVSIRNTKNMIRHLSPLLAVFLDLNVSILHGRRKRFVVGNMESTISQDTVQTSNYCRLVPWTVNFVELDWSPKYILEPQSYLANNCEGNCPIAPIDPYFNISNHVIVKFMQDKSLCCTPIEYNNQSLMFFRNVTVTVIRSVPGMSVSRCGCR